MNNGANYPSKGEGVVYGIIDPRNGRFIYVGRSNDFCARREKHLSTTEPTVIARALRALLDAGLEPIFVILETTSQVLSLPALEATWTTTLTKAGHRLLNVCDHLEGSDRSAKRDLVAEVIGEISAPKSRPTAGGVWRVGAPEADMTAWSRQEETDLIEEYLTHRLYVTVIARRHGRTPTAVVSRLRKLAGLRNLPQLRQQLIEEGYINSEGRPDLGFGQRLREYMEKIAA